jgi:hypothetical protein
MSIIHIARARSFGAVAAPGNGVTVSFTPDMVGQYEFKASCGTTKKNS